MRINILIRQNGFPDFLVQHDNMVKTHASCCAHKQNEFQNFVFLLEPIQNVYFIIILIIGFSENFKHYLYNDIVSYRVRSLVYLKKKALSERINEAKNN